VSELGDQLATHRPDLLRHCYRMLGSYADAEDIVQDVLVNAWKARASYAGAVPIQHWLMRIATNACLNEQARRKRRGLPQLDRAAATAASEIERFEAADWLTPAPDAQLFAPARELAARETVALAFLALLQRLPPRQRAVLLLKDVVGWSADEIADALDTTVASVSSALHRARETIAVEPAAAPAPREPSPEVLGAYIRSWQDHDIDALVRLLRDDVVFAMPPHGTWFRGADVETFFRGERLARGFWAQPSRVVATRANGRFAFAFYSGDGTGFQRHSLQVVDFVGDRAAQIIQFIGADYLRGFAVPERID
jgi:RNA polymerase sigma-70 factor (ECF subfamily)